MRTERKRRSDNEWHERNRGRVRRNKVRLNKRSRREVRAFICQYKTGKPCADCGHTFPPKVMDFDHRPGTVKKGNLANISLFSSVALALREIAKCDLVCSNCHRIRTFSRPRTVQQSEPDVPDETGLLPFPGGER